MAGRAAAAALGALLLALAAACRAETINAEALYPEGPLWLDGALLYAEMTGDRVTRWDGSVNRTFWHEPRCGPTSLAPLAGGRLLVLCHLAGTLAIVRPGQGTLEHLAADAAGRALRDPNDSIADGRGGAFLTDPGSFWKDAPATGRVYHLSPAGELRLEVEGLRYANGVALAPGGALLFVSEHLARRVLAFDVAGDGSLSGKRLFFDLDAVAEPAGFADAHAGPDGLEVDPAGNLFVCEYGAGRLLVVSPAGRLRLVLPVAMPYVTNVALDPDGRSLAVTGAWNNSLPPYPGQVLLLANPLAPPPG